MSPLLLRRGEKVEVSQIVDSLSREKTMAGRRDTWWSNGDGKVAGSAEGSHLH